MKSSSDLFSVSGNIFFPTYIALSVHVAAGVGPHSFAGVFSSSRSLTHVSFAGPPWWTTWPFRFLSQECVEAVC